MENGEKRVSGEDTDFYLTPFTEDEANGGDEGERGKGTAIM